MNKGDPSELQPDGDKLMLWNGNVRVELPRVVSFSQEGEITTIKMRDVPLRSENRWGDRESGFTIGDPYYPAVGDRQTDD